MKRIMEIMMGYGISTIYRIVLVMYHRLALDSCNLFLYRLQYPTDISYNLFITIV
jgi:hypothetical protein